MLDLLNVPKDQRKYIRPKIEDMSDKKPHKSLKHYLRVPEYKNQEEKQINAKQPQTPAQFFLKPLKPPKPVKVSPHIQQDNLLYQNWYLFNQNKMMQYQIYSQKQKLTFIISEFIKINDKIKNIDNLFNKKLKELNIQVGGSTPFKSGFAVDDISTTNFFKKLKEWQSDYLIPNLRYFKNQLDDNTSQFNTTISAGIGEVTTENISEFEKKLSECQKELKQYKENVTQSQKKIKKNISETIIRHLLNKWIQNNWLPENRKRIETKKSISSLILGDDELIKFINYYFDIILDELFTWASHSNFDTWKTNTFSMNESNSAVISFKDTSSNTLKSMLAKMFRDVLIKI